MKFTDINMKRIIITAGVVLAAFFTFYVHESGSLTHSIALLSKNAGYKNMLGLNMITHPKLDVYQIDL